jgi:hypothetical protein
MCRTGRDLSTMRLVRVIAVTAYRGRGRRRVGPDRTVEFMPVTIASTKSRPAVTGYLV